MATNLTPKQEAFVQAYLTTGNASKAYRAAYNSESMKVATVNRSAKELLENPKIAARLSTLRERAVEITMVTVQSLTDELEEARALALQEGQPSAAVSASMGKAKLHGLLVDKAAFTGTFTTVTEVKLSGPEV